MREYTAKFTSYMNGVRLVSAPVHYHAGEDFNDAVHGANLMLQGMRSIAKDDARIDLFSVEALGFHGEHITEGGASIWDNRRDAS